MQTHSHVQTGQWDSKFGLNPQEFLQAVQSCLRIRPAPSRGYISTWVAICTLPEPVISAIEIALDLIQDMPAPDRVAARGDSAPVVGGVFLITKQTCHISTRGKPGRIDIAEKLISGCRARKLPTFPPSARTRSQPGCPCGGCNLPHRSSQTHPVPARYLLVDGGLADNPRPALYQARYSALCRFVNLSDQQPIQPGWLDLSVRAVIFLSTDLAPARTTPWRSDRCSSQRCLSD